MILAKLLKDNICNSREIEREYGNRIPVFRQDPELMFILLLANFQFCPSKQILHSSNIFMNSAVAERKKREIEERERERLNVHYIQKHGRSCPYKERETAGNRECLEIFKVGGGG